MAYIKKWLEEPWLYYYKLSNVNEYIPAISEIVNRLNAVDGRLYVIADLLLIPQIGGLQTFLSGDFYRIANQIFRHPNLGYWVIVHPSAFTRFLAALVTQPPSPNTTGKIFSGARNKTSVLATVAEAETLCRRIGEADANRAKTYKPVTVDQTT